MAVVIPLKLVYTPVDATVTAIRNYQVPSTNQSLRDVKIHVWKWSCALTSRLGAVLGRKGDDHDRGVRPPSLASLAPSRECSLLSFSLSLLSLPLASVLFSRSRSRFSRFLSRVFSPLVLALASLAPSREC